VAKKLIYKVVLIHEPKYNGNSLTGDYFVIHSTEDKEKAREVLRGIRATMLDTDIAYIAF
jgi:hypothetical protein